MPRTTRRTFLKSAAAGGAFLSLPAATYRAALLAQDKPSETVRVGSIGVGNQGTGNMKAIRKNVVAICDVDSSHLAAAAAELEKGGAKPKTFADYRKLLESKDIDAVVITTPDHWHALTDDRRVQGRQGRVLREAAVADGDRRPRDGQGGARQQADRADRQSTALGEGIPPRVRTRPQRAARQADPGEGRPAGSELGRSRQARSPIPTRPPSSTTTSGSARPRSGRTTRSASTTSSASSGTTPAARRPTSAPTTSTSPSGASAWTRAGPRRSKAPATFNTNKWFETPETAKQTFTYANGVTVNCTLGRGGHPGGVHVRRREGDDLRQARRDHGDAQRRESRGPLQAPDRRDEALRLEQPPPELARLHQESRSCRSATSRSATAPRPSATSGTSPSAPAGS